MITYEITNLGREKWCGTVKAQSEAVEHVEAALVAAARERLMSQQIDFIGDTESGTIVVGGIRPVGQYRRVR